MLIWRYAPHFVFLPLVKSLVAMVFHVLTLILSSEVDQMSGHIKTHNQLCEHYLMGVLEI